MIKKYFCFLSLLLLCSQAFSQTPGTYNHKGKTYLVFPYRMGDTEEVPMIGYKIPDGEYIAFTVFNFKRGFSFKQEKPHHLTDTTIVAAIFTIKHNMGEGPAVFYSHYYSDKGTETKKPFRQSQGMLSHNLKTGVWIRSAPGKIPDEYTTYENGRRNGYHTTYNSKGQLELKEKYCNGDPCDTLFSFINGKPQLSYDIPNSDPSRELSPYTRGLELLGVMDIQVNTFYKTYDGKGKLVYDLKFKEGKVLPYDSIGMSDKYSTKYVTVKDLGNGKKRLMYVSENNSNKRITAEYYNSYLYRTINQRYSYKIKKKLFSGKRRVEQKNASSREEQFIDPESINDSSLTPVLAEKEISIRDTNELYYIPKYRFAFKKNEYSSLAGIDTVRRIMFLDQRSHYYKYDPYYIKYQSLCISKEQQELLDLQTNPYMEKAFILYNERPDFKERYNNYEVELRDLETIPYYTFPKKYVYYKNDTLLNGRYYFSDAPIHKHWPKGVHYAGYSNAENGFALGSFTQGKKEGLWLNMRVSSYIKKTPADLKGYVFSHPKKCSSLEEAFYKDGMKDGSYIEYSKHNPKRSNYYSKDPEFMYTEKECSYTRDTLNGAYKTYHPNARVKQELHFVMGRPDGEYKQYFLDGSLYKIMRFNKGNLEGPYMAYSEGKMNCYANFKNNRLVDSLVYYSNGVAWLRFYLRNDTVVKRIGYFPNGSIKEVMTFNKESTYTLTDRSVSDENYIETIKESGEEAMRNIQGLYRNYYDNGQLLSEGEIRDGELYGPWKFHAINGILVHEVNFADTTIHLPNDTALTEIAGFYKGYYTTGAKRCTGYIKDLELSYDCFTKQDKAMLDFYALDFFDINGKQLLKNGNGYCIQYDANGLRVSAGKLVNCREDSLWKYYNPEQKLEETGNYVHGKKEGVWYEGSLEGINFEDGACFDMNNTEELKAFEAERKKLSISRIIYKNGRREETVHFNSDLNKTYKQREEFEGQYQY